MNRIASPLEIIELVDPAARSRVLIAPARGGLVTRFVAADRPLLFLDEATLLDEKKNVRGGVPVLFPSPGKLAGGRFQQGAKSGALDQHGFARNLSWQLVESRGASEVTLQLAATPDTLARFPWDFLLRYRIALHGTTLRIDQQIHNRGAEPMPFACGFHPYFFVPQEEKAAARIETSATRAFDNARGQQVTLEGPIDLTAAEVDLHLEDHGRSEAALLVAGGARIEVACSAQFQRWVVWTLAGRDFVCLEPWTAPANALNTGEGLLFVAPRGMTELWTELRLAPG